MDAIKKEAAPLQNRLLNTPDRNHNAIKRIFKHAVVLLALWRVISYRTATAMIRALGVSNE